MESWTTERVCDFLTNNHFDEEVVGIFKTNKICGSVLSSLNEADLKELGLTALGDRRRLQSLIKRELQNDISARNTLTELEANYACVSTPPSLSYLALLHTQPEDTSHKSNVGHDTGLTLEDGDVDDKDDSPSVCYIDSYIDICACQAWGQVHLKVP